MMITWADVTCAIFFHRNEDLMLFFVKFSSYESCGNLSFAILCNYRSTVILVGE